MSSPLGRGEIAKYHALGNDYMVIDSETFGQTLTHDLIVRLCHRHLGVGSDGILLRVAPTAGAEFALRIFNPDGSEAEKSGNGLRIFARFLYDCGYSRSTAFHIETLGGRVHAALTLEGDNVTGITVAMGQAQFDVVAGALPVQDETLTVTRLRVGNPHCVVFVPRLDVAALRRLGPQVESHAQFPQRINLQLVRIVDRNNIDILIWERGAGETTASGSSSCAAAAAARRHDWVDAHVTVHMPGGTLAVHVADDFHIVMTGPATPVFRGLLTAD